MCKNQIKGITLIVGVILTISMSSCLTSKLVPYADIEIQNVLTPYEITYDTIINEYAVFDISSKDVSNDFIFENNELSVYYKFYANRNTEIGTLLFKIENRTAKPVYVDMAHSSFINNGRAQNYTDYVDVNSKVILIPDKSYMEFNKFRGITETNKEDVMSEINLTKSLTNMAKEYTEQTSILVFRNKLVYDFNEIIKEGKVIDNKFWVSKLSIISEPSFLQLSPVSLKNKFVYRFDHKETLKANKYKTEAKEVVVTNYKSVERLSIFGWIVLISSSVLVLVASAY